MKFQLNGFTSERNKRKRAVFSFVFLLLLTATVAFFSLTYSLAFAQSAPTIPADLTVVARTTTSISLAWSPSTDSDGTLAGYKIYRNGVWLVTLPAPATTWFKNSSLAPNTSYRYTVLAYDTSGNMSGQSSSVTVNTLATTPANNGNNTFGVSVGEALLGLSTADRNAYLANIASLGVTWIRFDMDWSHIQPNNSTSYNWSNIDMLVAAANSYHLKLLPILDYTPTWAESSACKALNLNANRCPPAQMSQFAAYAKAAAQRYTPDGITDWEIWNEQNLSGMWQPAADGKAYEALLQLTANAIRSVNPTAGIITGGMAPAVSSNGNLSPTDFLTQLYAAGGKPYFNAVGMHPYTYPAMPTYYAPWNAWSQLASTPISLRSIMTANGDSGKRIWMTEYGAPTGGPGNVEDSTQDTQFSGAPDHVTGPVQAAMFASAITSVKQDTWSGPLFFYTRVDMGTSETTNENFFGLLHYDGSEKPAYATIKDLLIN